LNKDKDYLPAIRVINLKRIFKRGQNGEQQKLALKTMIFLFSEAFDHINKYVKFSDLDKKSASNEIDRIFKEKNFQNLLPDELLFNIKNNFINAFYNDKKLIKNKNLFFSAYYPKQNQGCFVDDNLHIRIELKESFKELLGLTINCILIPFYFANPIGKLNYYILYFDTDNSFKLKLVFLVKNPIKNPKHIRHHKGVLGIDFGFTNFLTMANSLNGFSSIYDGKILRKIKNDYKKRVNDITNSNKSKENKKKLLKSALNKRNNQILDFINKCVNLTISYVLANNLNKIAVGFVGKEHMYNKEGKCIYLKEHFKFMQQLEIACCLKGIKYVTVDEYGTSKIDSMNNEPLRKRPKKHYKKIVSEGKRDTRGLYYSKIGIAISSDVNACINIARLAGALSDIEKRNKGLRIPPRRINPVSFNKSGSPFSLAV